MTVIPNGENTPGFVESAVNTINKVHTQYLLYGLVIAVIILFAYNQTPEFEKIAIFCLGGFFTFINTNAK